MCRVFKGRGTNSFQTVIRKIEKDRFGVRLLVNGTMAGECLEGCNEIDIG